jgi:hypothetical protein
MNKDNYMDMIKSVINFDSQFFKTNHKIAQYILSDDSTHTDLDEIKALCNQLNDNEKERTKDAMEHFKIIKDIKHNNNKKEKIDTIINLLNY